MLRASAEASQLKGSPNNVSYEGFGFTVNFLALALEKLS